MPYNGAPISYKINLVAEIDKETITGSPYFEEVSIKGGINDPSQNDEDYHCHQKPEGYFDLPCVLFLLLLQTLVVQLRLLQFLLVGIIHRAGADEVAGCIGHPYFDVSHQIQGLAQ